MVRFGEVMKGFLPIAGISTLGLTDTRRPVDGLLGFAALNPTYACDVGWVERSEAQHRRSGKQPMG